MFFSFALQLFVVFERRGKKRGMRTRQTDMLQGWVSYDCHLMSFKITRIYDVDQDEGNLGNRTRE